MALSNQLFLSILAMDAYNRGYDPGLEVAGGLGDATVGADSAILGNDVDISAGFFAQSYFWNDNMIISYRGTDSAIDLWTGWTVGLGFPATSQATLAIEFYEEITGNSVFEGESENVQLTGHSLGGGLAGFVSTLSGTAGTGFDHMPFGIAAAAAFYAEAYLRTGKRNQQSRNWPSTI